jgi:hypothetical protein
MELENIISSEISWAQKAKNDMFSFICSRIVGHGSHTKGSVCELLVYLGYQSSTKGRPCVGGIGKGKET